ncbi:DNA cytosine methyltransferase [Roseobacter litoralis]|uniref:DNA cytosine methyltransferase n=1 Tax=Roseobacter litoralis TaxID=42443 RepID=UPI002494163E|nr:DNA cytosine methyltransferase [Roseobacter litoralis]
MSFQTEVCQCPQAFVPMQQKAIDIKIQLRYHALMNHFDKQHEEDKMRPIGIDLFAGAGGMSLGFEQAGFDVAAAVEIDPVHCAVHKFNFPQTAVIPASVSSLSGSQIRLAAGIGDRDVDCVFGGAPCQGFSLIGHRVLNDPRNELVLDFVRLVTELGAKSFVFENVKGLTVGKHKKFLEELVSAFDEAGYEVLVPWKVLNAAHFGTPQSRERLFLIGCRKGMTLPSYPAPQTNIAGRKPAFEGLEQGPSCHEALGDIPNADRFKTLLKADTVSTTGFGEPSRYASEMRCLTNEAWHFGHIRNWNPDVLTSSARTEHTDISRRRFSETTPGDVEPISRFFRLPNTGVSNTLRAGTDGSRGAFTSPRPIHYHFDRCITVREMARLHGFPDWFRLNATKWHGARQIGNSVPPPLARAVASAVMVSLNVTPTRSHKTIDLGDERLLTYDLSHAAKYFGVDRMPNRRDQKSGAKKRKQIDIERERLAGQAAHG